MKDYEDVREKAIQSIEGLYPPDSSYPETAAKGEELLAQAKRNTASWRNEPTAVLVEFARLCMEEERLG